MSERLTKLRTAIEKLDEAETALFLAQRAFYTEKFDGFDYNIIDDQYEVVGDAKTILRDVLGRAERQALQAAQESAKIIVAE